MSTTTKKATKTTPPRPEPKATRPPVPAGILDGNGRTARLARWLREMPKRAQVDTLVLETKSEDGWTRVQSWERAEVGMHLALTIDALVTDMANEVGAYLTAKLVWVDSKTGEAWTEHALRAQPEGLQVGQAFAGGVQDVAIQTQRALERLVSAFMGGIETSTQSSARAAEIASSNFESAQAELQLARERIMQLEREKSELELELEQALGAAERIQQEAQSGAQQSQIASIFGQLLTAKPPTPPTGKPS